MSKIIEGVYGLDDSSGANTYIIVDEGVTLIDTGMNKNPPKISAELKRLGFGVKDIKNIVITHAHYDHYQCLAQLKEGTSARVLVGEADADVVEGKVPMPLPKGGMGLVFRVIRPMIRIRPVQVDVRLNDGDTVDVLGGLKVISLRGHTPGSIGLYLPEMSLIFSGDAVGHRKDQLQVPAMYKENRDECNAAIRRISEMNAEVILPGHGTPIRPNASKQLRTFYQGLTGK